MTICRLEWLRHHHEYANIHSSAYLSQVIIKHYPSSPFARCCLSTSPKSNRHIFVPPIPYSAPPNLDSFAWLRLPHNIRPLSLPANSESPTCTLTVQLTCTSSSYCPWFVLVSIAHSLHPLACCFPASPPIPSAPAQLFSLFSICSKTFQFSRKITTVCSRLTHSHALSVAIPFCSVPQTGRKQAS
jgi:hypothetical protein